MKIENDSVGARRRYAPRLPESLPPATSIGEESDRALPALSQQAEDNWANEHCANEPGGFFPCGEHNSLWALVPRFINTTAFVASIFGSGEARRGSIPRSGAVTEEQRSQNRKATQPSGRRFFLAPTSLLTPYRPRKGMRVARASSGPKIPRRKRGRIYEMGYLAQTFRRQTANRYGSLSRQSVETAERPTGSEPPDTSQRSGAATKSSSSSFSSSSATAPFPITSTRTTRTRDSRGLRRFGQILIDSQASAPVRLSFC